MAELKIPEQLQAFQKPASLLRHVTPVVVRNFSIAKVLLERNLPNQPRLPRNLVPKGGNRIEVVAKMIGHIQGTGDWEIYPKYREWKRETEGETDYFFINGSKMGVVEGYQWMPLTELGAYEFPEGKEGRTLFDDIYELVTGGSLLRLEALM